MDDWELIDGKWYWFNGAGYAVANAWKQGQDGKWYYLGGDCAMAARCVLQIGNEVFAFGQDGAMLTGEVRLRTNERGALFVGIEQEKENHTTAMRRTGAALEAVALAYTE